MAAGPLAGAAPSREGLRGYIAQRQAQDTIARRRQQGALTAKPLGGTDIEPPERPRSWAVLAN